jgi:hypothetical protein
MTLPYENATSGKAAIDEMQKILRGFGASSFGVMEDFDAGKVTVQFQWRERRVTIAASAKGYAAAWLRHHPFNPSRHRVTKVEHERRALQQANISVYSILRDWIKGQVTAVEVGMLSFEGAFLGQIMLPNGETVLERVEATKMLALPDATGRAA